MFIKNLEDGIRSDLSKFADDTKLIASSKTKEKLKVFQTDFRKLNEWPITWQMNFKAEKCEVLPLGNKRLKDTI